jgi:DNA-directed RNA polymerase subunit RPC12/RpoP
MSEFKFSCPHCDQHLQCNERLGGRQIQCPACNHLIVVPPSRTRVAANGFPPESGQTWRTFIPPALTTKEAPTPPQG